MSKAVKDTLWVATANGLLLVLRILMLPFLVRSLSKEEYGTYSQVLLIVDMLIGILGLGVARGIYVVYAAQTFSRKTILSGAFTMMILVGLVGYGLLWLTRPILVQEFNNPALMTFLPVYGLVIILSVPASVLSATLLYFNKPKHSVWATIIQTIITLGVLFIAVIKRDLVIAFWGMGFGALVQFAWLLLATARMEKPGIRWHRGVNTALYKASWGTAAAVALATVALRSGEVFSGVLLPVEVYVLYRAGAFELPFFNNLYASVSTVLAPRLTQLYQQGDFKTIVALKRRGISATASLLYPMYLYLVFFGPFLIGKYLGEAYQESAVVFVIFNAVLMLRVTEYGDILQAAQRQRPILVINAIYTLAALVLGMLGIKYFGIYAGAAAHVGSLALYVLMQMIMYRRLLQVSIMKLFDVGVLLRIVGLSTVLLIPAYLFFRASPSVAMAIGLGLVFALLYSYLAVRLQLVDSAVANVMVKAIPVRQEAVRAFFGLPPENKRSN